MRKKTKNLVPYAIILAAKEGDIEAMQAVFRHNASYIAKWSVRPFIDANGNRRFAVDEDICRELENHLAMAVIEHFRVV
jgi:hypothetical protein